MDNWNGYYLPHTKEEMQLLRQEAHGEKIDDLVYDGVPTVVLPRMDNYSSCIYTGFSIEKMSQLCPYKAIMILRDRIRAWDSVVPPNSIFIWKWADEARGREISLEEYYDLPKGIPVVGHYRNYYVASLFPRKEVLSAGLSKIQKMMSKEAEDLAQALSQ